VRRRLRIACAALILAASGCGIGTSDRVEEVDSGLLGGLNEPTSTSTPPASSEPSTSSSTPVGPTTTVEMEQIRLYFIQGSELVYFDTEVPQNAELRRRIDLLDEVPAELADAGVRTAVLPDLVRGIARWGSDGVTVHLDSDRFAQIEDSDQRLMVGQLVLTLTGQPGIAPGIDRVDFTRDGDPLAVFLRDNTLGRPGEPVRRGDYDVLLAGAALPSVDVSRSTISTSRSSGSLTSGP
jgi:hypothetical protein